MQSDNALKEDASNRGSKVRVTEGYKVSMLGESVDHRQYD